MTNKSKPYISLIYAVLFCLSGCAENKYIQTTDKLCVPSSTKAEAVKAAEGILAKMHFSIDKLDAEAGYVKTHPLPGAQTFEFWRADSVGAFNATEADLHSIRRTVELNFTQQVEKICIDCRATTQRMSLPDSQTTSPYNQSIMSPRERSLRNLVSNVQLKENMTWIDLGRDNQLETEILKRIDKQLTAIKR